MKYRNPFDRAPRGVEYRGDKRQAHLADYAERKAEAQRGVERRQEEERRVARQLAVNPLGTLDESKAETCARCDRAVFMVVAGEPRCSWHVTGKLGGAGLGLARSGERARSKR